MKKALLIGILVGLTGLTVFAQAPAAAKVEAATPAPPELPRFDIDFPGGKPLDLVKALNKPLNGTLNVIIPDEHDDVLIPPFRLKSVNVAQVFSALQRVSQRVVYFELPTGNASKRSMHSSVESFEFSAPGPVTENTVWAFRAQRANRPPELSGPSAYRYYQLGPYLEGLKIEDIITAIQTGWKMIGVKKEPALKFHPETSLLVAVGKAEDLALIDEALAGMPRGGKAARIKNESDSKAKN